MNKKNKINFKEYIATILVVSVAVISLCMCVELDLLFKTEKKVNFNELNVANLAKFATIEQLEKRLFNEPNNYYVSIKLAQIYESLNEFDKANEYYQTALKTSQRSDYSLYSYALFCARRNLYTIAATLCEELSENNKKMPEYKAQIYEQLGDSFTESNQVEASVRSYQIAQKYAKNVKGANYLKKINKKFANAYSKLADYHIANDEIELAILDLNNSLEIYSTDMAKYKLGLIYLTTEKSKAEKYIYDTFRSNPYLINPYIYNALLEDLILESNIEGKSNLSECYKMKLNRFKNKLNELYLYKTDLNVENISIIFKKKLLSKDNKYYLIFDLKNNTKFKVNELYVQVELFVNSKRYELQKNIIHHSNPIDEYGISSMNKIELPSDFKIDKLNKTNDIIVKFYAKRKQDAPWTLLKIDVLDF